MITDRDRAALRNLFQSPGWRVVEQITKELTDQYKSDPVVRDTEWETLKTALMNEGRVRGINSLLQELMEQAHERPQEPTSRDVHNGAGYPGF